MAERASSPTSPSPAVPLPTIPPPNPHALFQGLVQSVIQGSGGAAGASVPSNTTQFSDAQTQFAEMQPQAQHQMIAIMRLLQGDTGAERPFEGEVIIITGEPAASAGSDGMGENLF